jgi:hypothetical protein
MVEVLVRSLTPFGERVLFALALLAGAAALVLATRLGLI